MQLPVPVLPSCLRLLVAQISFETEMLRQLAVLGLTEACFYDG